MISHVEKELIIAYFQGGNAKERGNPELKNILETIKESAKESKIEKGENPTSTYKPPSPNPAR